MTTAQKIIKYFAIALAASLIVAIFSSIIFGLSQAGHMIGIFTESDRPEDGNSGRKEPIGSEGNVSGSQDDGAMENVKIDLKEKEITALDVELKYINLQIKQGEYFAVETNDTDITCMQNRETFVIKDEKKLKFKNQEDRELIVYIPEGFCFQDVEIEAGAGEMEIDYLQTEELSLDLGAGKTTIHELLVLREADIDSGAGKIEILSGTLKNLDLNQGVGHLTLCCELIGNSEVDAGIGNVELELLGSLEQYSFKANKGLGPITLNGEELTDGVRYGNGDCFVKIDGNVGKIQIACKEKQLG